MRNVKKLATPDVESALIADAEDIGAWESPISVSPIRRTDTASYRGEKIPIGITVAGGREVNANEIYDFIARRVSGAVAYTFAPRGIAAASIDFYLVLSAVASVASIANIFWTAYDRFISHEKNKNSNSASIHLVVQQNNGSIQLNLKNISDKEAFIERLTSFVEEAKRADSRIAHETMIQELEQSGLWTKVNDEQD